SIPSTMPASLRSSRTCASSTVTTSPPRSRPLLSRAKSRGKTEPAGSAIETLPSPNVKDTSELTPSGIPTEIAPVRAPASGVVSAPAETGTGRSAARAAPMTADPLLPAKNEPSENDHRVMIGAGVVGIPPILADRDSAHHALRNGQISIGLEHD